MSEIFFFTVSVLLVAGLIALVLGCVFDWKISRFP